MAYRPRLCETCGEDFIPTSGRQRECEACMEAPVVENPPDSTVRQCLKCGAEVVGRYVCGRCRKANRELLREYTPAALGVGGMD
ncbi:MAG: hypothetical protein AB1491_00200 [Thermodesulfobacteriota bacterium]